jgi:hypothetical protein
MNKYVNIHSSKTKEKSLALDEIDKFSKKIEEIIQTLIDCTNFHFLDNDKLKVLIEHGGNSADYRNQLNRLLILSIKSFCISISKIIESILESIKLKNEIMLALSIRAFTEHLSVFDDLSYEIKSNSHVFRERKKSEFVELADVNCPDLQVLNELLTFLIGARVLFPNNMPSESDGGNKWKKYLSNWRNQNKQFSPKQILDCIDNFGKRNRFRKLRPLYEFLCEYVHPNSSSRMFKYSRISVDGTLLFEENNKSIPEGFDQILNLLEQIIPKLIEVGSVNIEKLMSFLIKMPVISGYFDYKQGRRRFFDIYGREIWIDKAVSTTKYNFKPSSSSVRIPLDQKQIERLKNIKESFSEFDKATFYSFENNIKKALNPEVEIQIYEHLVNVYKKELSDRKESNKYKIRKKLFTLIMELSMGENRISLSSKYLWIKRFPYYERVEKRVNDCNLIKASMHLRFSP